MDRGAWQATVRGVTRVGHDRATKHSKQKPCYSAPGYTARKVQDHHLNLGLIPKGWFHPLQHHTLLRWDNGGGQAGEQRTVFTLNRMIFSTRF